ncbi:hypothetical protein OS189_15010 [Sulfitobacter sp. F26169L]|uniref:hypothetical protein n=1 Tax=Sulfitobacter sp. F26169L TaxID=2996015 RepID=UPI00226089A9|nr:hypothetical protein [Sulfitobacter sp. F26169L]MCX7567654.1 hypothetical protein [Sulfitobacter sp. F26169L]
MKQLKRQFAGFFEVTADGPMRTGAAQKVSFVTDLDGRYPLVAVAEAGQHVDRSGKGKDALGRKAFASISFRAYPSTSIGFMLIALTILWLYLERYLRVVAFLTR